MLNSKFGDINQQQRHILYHLSYGYQFEHRSHARGQVQSNSKREEVEDFINEHCDY